MKRFGILIVVVLAVGGLVWWQSNAAKDRRIWNRFRAELTDDRVAAVEVWPPFAPDAKALSAADQTEVLRLLREARFERTNRQGFGPTPDQGLTIRFRDGRVEHAGHWGGGTLEVGPRWLDPQTQFLVHSDGLGRWLRDFKQ